jgi:hypothetical protein
VVQVTDAWSKEVAQETDLRDTVFKAGATMALRMSHAPLSVREAGDEEGRLCVICRQNSYLSFVACPCDMAKNVCLRHHRKLCKCHPSRHVLFFRHTTQELDTLVDNCKAAVIAAEKAGRPEALTPCQAEHVGSAWSEAAAKAAAAADAAAGITSKAAPSGISVRGSSLEQREARAKQEEERRKH